MIEPFAGLRIHAAERLARSLKALGADLGEQLLEPAEKLGVPLPPLMIQTDPSLDGGQFMLQRGSSSIIEEVALADDPAPSIAIALGRAAADLLLTREWIEARVRNACDGSGREMIDAVLVACRELLNANVRLTRLDWMLLAWSRSDLVAWRPETSGRHFVAPLPGAVAVPVERPLTLIDQWVEIGRAAALPDQLRARFPGGELLISTLTPRRAANGAFEPEPLSALVDTVRGAAAAGAVLIVAHDLRREIWRRLRPAHPDLLVVAPHELPREAALRRFSLLPPTL